MTDSANVRLEYTLNDKTVKEVSYYEDLRLNISASHIGNVFVVLKDSKSTDRYLIGCGYQGTTVSNYDRLGWLFVKNGDVGQTMINIPSGDV